ncbi:ketoacyl-ACP synthase III [Fimbriimonadia bacterium ATM]|nr:MAG: ketoacyl-ACP synthase III [Armatimonadota bacterium]MBC6969656.1 ketoacyl-ACP synthase III [Armatimonadota bacterium]MCE7898925.1 ketoacyl-ACP synthase III [Armatimonadetes bacterium ATM1]MDL1927380.1 ketoacyl-ACP synthase III [Fimbriimonadia bacterium ATM]RIJ97908.1 MAG: 3-oxoacyl-ACP synthase [Armatimonadota bacterium]
MSRPNAVIRSIGMSVAERVMTNHDFEEFLDTSDEWIKSRTGISERHIASVEETASTFATRAAAEALEKAQVDPKEVEMILVATVTGDMQFPSTSCLVQYNLGATNAGAFDVGAACAGFIYACEILSSMIKGGSVRNGIVVGVDVLTKIVDWTDRSTCILFGDGGGAVFMEASDEDRGVMCTVMKSDGSGGKYIRLAVGGSLYPSRSPQAEGKSDRVYMAGREVYKFAVKAMGDSCCTVLEKAGLSVDDVDLFVPHQANLRIIEAASDRLGLSPEKVFINVDRYGNMSAGSIPVALYEAEQMGRLKRGDLVMTVGFGAGLVWGANLIRW